MTTTPFRSSNATADAADGNRHAPLRGTSRDALAWLLCLLGSMLSMNVGADQDPVTVVRDTTGQLFAQVQQQRDALRGTPDAIVPLVEQLLLPHVDLERTSRLVLGKHWRSATDQQRERFMGEFRTLLLRTYSTAVLEFTGIDVDYLETRYSEDRDVAFVRTRVKFPDGRPEVHIDYRLARAGSEWKVFDVLVGGVSLVTTYRSSFGNEVARGGLDGLLRTLSDRNAGNQQGI